MKAPRPPAAAATPRPPGTAALRARLADAEETLRAIRTGDVDTVMVTSRRGPRVFTLQGAGEPYRMLIESMNEGALTLAPDKTILYANQCFARLVKCPLEQVVGGSFGRFLSADDRSMLRDAIKRPGKSGAKIQVRLQASDGAETPVQISVRQLADRGRHRAPIGMVVTDMTEALRIEELLRALTHRVVQVQEAERGRVALELHDNITQQLIAVLFRSQALANTLSRHHGPAKKEAKKLRELLGKAADDVERISHDLRPSILDQLGLVAVLRGATADFVVRTGVPVSLAGVRTIDRLPADTELALYRILEEALKNVAHHARARHVTVSLQPVGDFVRLAISDDGVGFDTNRRLPGRKPRHSLGLLGMRERAAYVGGVLTVKSGLRAGTEIEALVPLPPVIAAA